VCCSRPSRVVLYFLLTTHYLLAVQLQVPEPTPTPQALDGAVGEAQAARAAVSTVNTASVTERRVIRASYRREKQAA
jgi:hypothetical protein